LKPVQCSPQRSDGVSRAFCPCGTPLVQPMRGSGKQYCSARCRQSAKQRRQAHSGANGDPLSKRLECVPQRSDAVRETVCPCGALVPPNKRYCSHRCRQRAYRQRQAHSQPPSPLAAGSAATLPGCAEWEREANGDPVSERVPWVLQRSGEVREEACLCGTSLVQSVEGPSRRYCSHRCRQRAYRQRQAKRSCKENISCFSSEVSQIGHVDCSV
jgi:hypothetical protein